jgi:hypothetical protein
MRLLLTFLLLVCIQSFVVCTKEDGTITIAQQTINKSPCKSEVSALISKKESNEFINYSNFDISSSIHQYTSHHINLPLKIINSKALAIYIRLQQTITFFKDPTNHSYQFIISCLYPKHTFW